MSEAAAFHADGAVAAVPSFASLRARARLAARTIPLDDSDLVDWADLCLTAGHRAEARLLYQVAAIRTGFSPQLTAAQDKRGASTGLWAARSIAGPVATGGVVDIAIADLKSYAIAFAARPVRVAKRHIADSIEVDADRIHAVGQGASLPPVDLGETVDALFQRLRDAPDSAPDRIAATLLALRDAAGDVPNFAARDFVGAPLPMLASVIAFEAIRSFIDDHLDLIEGDRASVGLFHRAAQFDSFGLGPYFGSVAQVVRRYRDLLELAGTAFDVATAAGDGATLDHWIVQLSRSIDGPLLDEVIDELADAHRAEALGGILDRLLTAPSMQIDWNRIMRIRDAALDNLDYTLASRAQWAVVERNLTEVPQWRLLGDIDGSAGRIAAAEQSFERCLALDPGNRDVQDRIIALKSRSFDLYAVGKGFTSPEDRQLGRLRRREGRAILIEPARASVIGVQVNY